MWRLLLDIYNSGILLYTAALQISYLVFLLMSFRVIRRYIQGLRFRNVTSIGSLPNALPISIVMPAYNEELTIAQAAMSMLRLQYPQFEVVLVNDGSKDRTLEVLIETFKLEKVYRAWRREVNSRPIRGVYITPLYPNLVVVDKENGGSKADAVNAGINISKFPLLCIVDADSLLDQDALMRVARLYIEDPESTVGVGGLVRVANGCEIKEGRVVKVRLPKEPLAMFQNVEYFRAFLMGRIAWSAVDALLIISGAFGLFRRDQVVKVGGYKEGVIGEDFEIVMQLRETLGKEGKPCKLAFVCDPACWTEAPTSMKVLGVQRARWQRGLMQALWAHRKMWFNPRYGAAGMLAIPYMLLFEVLGPVIETSGLVMVPVMLALGWVKWPFALFYYLLAVVAGIFVSIGALVLEEVSYAKYPRLRDILRLAMYSVLENFGYRQLTVWWRLKGIWQHLTKRTLVWGRMTRTGFGPQAKTEKRAAFVVEPEAVKPKGPAAPGPEPIIILDKEDSEKFKAGPQNPPPGPDEPK
ncbi:MAG TPA: glycosyltransferase [Planctomycetota bacterium]|jgi:cellulose synthase/poly-beta-1,6-N-acetylglucosamine synthase-like glycosyltransferase